MCCTLFSTHRNGQLLVEKLFTTLREGDDVLELRVLTEDGGDYHDMFKLL